MKEGILVKRYAEAFVEYAKANIGLEGIVKEFKGLKAILSSGEGFKNFFENPQISYSEKCDTIDKMLKGSFSEEFRIFLKLLLEHGRLRHIDDICDYIRVTYSHGEEAEALLKTSYPLEIKSIQEIKKRLEEKLKKKMRLFLEIDPDLLGGVEVQIGNTVIDGSVRKRLDELKRKLMTVQVV